MDTDHPSTLSPLHYSQISPPIRATETLDSRYRVAVNPRRFFKVGRVFMVLWSEPTVYSSMGGSNYSDVSYGERVYSEIRRFVVVREGHNCCLCSPLHSYNKMGTTKRGIRPEDHAVVFAAGGKPQLLQGEDSLNKDAFPIVVEDPYVKIDPAARLNFAKVYTVEYNLKVRNMGRIDRDHLQRLQDYFHEAIGEDSMGAVDFVLATPGIVDLFCKYGQWLKGKVETLPNGEGVWADLGNFGGSLSEGKLKLEIELARHVYTTQSFDPVLKQCLEDQIKRLGSEVKKAKAFLEGRDADSIFKKSMFAIRYKRGAEEIMEALRKHQQYLSDLLVLVNMAKMQPPDELSQSRFRHNDSIRYTAVPFTSNIFIAKGDYREDDADTHSREISVIIERQIEHGVDSEKVLRNIASHLCHPLVHDVSRRGILHCLGYRMRPAPELVFELPKEMHNPQTLQTLITADGNKDYGGNPPLDFRFRLARQISEAVLSVHTVYESVRPDAILILRRKIDEADEDAKRSVGLGEPYFVNWKSLGEVSNINSCKRGSCEWTEHICRHPERQGIQMQQKGNLGHNIYSLGVFLLEVGLWDPLVRTRTADGNPQVSHLFRRAAKVDSAEMPEVALEKKLRNPQLVKEILLELAKRELPSRMGFRYTRLVVSCLTCLDTPSGFGAEIDFRKLNPTEAGVAFEELVLASFTDICV